MYKREAQLHRLRAKQGVLRQGLQAHQVGASAAHAVLKHGLKVVDEYVCS